MGKDLKVRQREILRDLMTSAVPLDIQYFIDKFGRSERTIRYDLKDLKSICKKHGVGIRYQTKTGFFIPVSQKMELSKILIEDKQHKEDAYLIGGEKERYMMLFLFLYTQRKRLTLEKLAERLYMSRSTLIRLIRKFNQEFGSRFHLESKKTGGYELVGDELVLRKMAAKLITKRIKASHLPEEWYLLLPMPNRERITIKRLQAISNIIKKANARYNVWISNTAFLGLISYCIAADIRHIFHTNRGRETDEQSGYAYELLREIVPEDLAVVKKEQAYLVQILEENGILVRVSEQDEDELWKALIEATEIVRKLGISEGKNFEMQPLYQDLFDHLKKFLHMRAMQGIKTAENYELILEVRENYHDFYRIAYQCAMVLEKKLNVGFSDTEICYMAVYLCKNCHQEKEEKKRALVVCTTGKGLSSLLAIRLQNVFPTLEVVGQISPYHFQNAKNFQNVDFIISTIPIEQSKLPVVMISRVLTSEDIVRIQEFLNRPAILMDGDKSYRIKALSGSGKRREMENSASVLSKLILTLIEYTSKLPDQYRPGQNALLGLIVHMSMAVARWYREDNHKFKGAEVETEYEWIQKEHGEAFQVMEQFFKLVERVLMVNIGIGEKMAFYLYLIRADERQ